MMARRRVRGRIGRGQPGLDRRPIRSPNADGTLDFELSGSGRTASVHIEPDGADERGGDRRLHDRLRVGARPIGHRRLLDVGPRCADEAGTRRADDFGSRPRRGGRRRPSRGHRRGRCRSRAQPSNASAPDRRRPRRGSRSRVRRLDRVRVARHHGDPAERREELQRSLIRSHAAGMGPAGRGRGRPGDDAAASPFAGAGLLRRASGRRRAYRRTAQRRDHPGRAGARVARGERRSGAARPRRPRPDRRRRVRCRSGRRRHRSDHVAGQGGARPDQRHGRDARHARARPGRPRRAAAHGRYHGGDVHRGAARARTGRSPPT